MARARDRRVGSRTTVWSRLLRRLAVAFAIESDRGSKRIRAQVLAGIVGVLFAVSGMMRQVFPFSWLAHAPIDLNFAMRTMSAGWFEPRNTIPVTLVDIDEATHRGWNSPAVTPRDALTRLLAIVTWADPTAVVVDIDLSWGVASDAARDDERVLREFLEAYAGPAPLVFPKRLEPGPAGTRRMAASRFDAIFARNSLLSWAHASFVSGGTGGVRQWPDWLEVCTDTGTGWLPSVPVRLALILENPPHGLPRPMPPPLRGSCLPADDRPGEVLFIGPRLTGTDRHLMRADARSVSAAVLLDPDTARDDAALFGSRVVLIGATHSAAGDFWMTPGGVLPGVELLANTVRFAPLRASSGLRAEVGYRVAALVMFAMFVAMIWWLRGIAVAVAALVATPLVVAIVIRVWDFYRVFDALEAAILLIVPYKGAQALLDLVEDWKLRGGHRGGFCHGVRVLLSVCLRESSGHDAT